MNTWPLLDRRIALDGWPSANQKVHVLYEDQSLLIIDKPAGLLCTAPPGIDSAKALLAQYVRQTETKNGPSDGAQQADRILLCHRL
ncbi:MAG: hypothetical protein AAFN70_03020, partial [Planctomycetota bacterium]